LRTVLPDSDERSALIERLEVVDRPGELASATADIGESTAIWRLSLTANPVFRPARWHAQGRNDGQQPFAAQGDELARVEHVQILLELGCIGAAELLAAH
jgi:hypothetical protein